jgi:hypothetical protein
VRTGQTVSTILLLASILAVPVLRAQTTPLAQPSPVQQPAVQQPDDPLPTESRTPPPKATPPPSAKAGVFPLEQVHRGLKGVAYTVFEGTEPAAMEVEILGVLRNALGPHQDMILARLGGKETIYTGVVAGMSGSPVYIDGKLVGAVAFRIGQFSKEPIAGITPIEQMMQVREMPTVPPDLLAKASSDSRGSGSDAVRPIETPLAFSGFTADTVKQFRDKFTALGMTAEAGIGGGASDIKQPEPIVPGSAVSALLVRGDMEIAATCTATYVDSKELLACGHPITQFGDVSVPMTKAEVIATLPSPLNAFKIVNTTEEVGAFTQDRQTAIRGEFGMHAQMIPVTMRIRRSDATAEAAAKVQTIHFDVADNPELTPLLLMVSVYQGLMQNNNYGAETTYSLRGRIATAAGPEVKLDALMAPTPMMPSAMSTTLLIGDRFSRLYANRSRDTRMRSIDLDVEAQPGRQTLEIEAATASGGQVHAGETVEVQAEVRPFHGAVRRLTIPVKIPATLQPGPLRVVVSDAASVDRMTTAPSGLGPELDVQQTAAELNAVHANDQLYVTLLMPSPQAEVDGRTLGAVPLSLANVLEPLRANRALLLSGESAIPVTSVPMHAMVTGQQVVTLQVE